MLNYIAKRVASSIPTMAAVAVFVFFIVRLAPGDPAAVIAGNNASSDDIARIRESLGLSGSIFDQFVIWISALLRLDAGYSFYQGMPVAKLIADRLGPTLSVAFGALFLAVSIAIPIGTVAAWRAGGWFDKILMSASVAGFSLPVFILGYALVYFFSITLRWLPVQGYVPVHDGFGGWLSHLILPWVALAIVYISLLSRVTRAAVLEALSEDFVRTAHAKGLSTWRVLTRHALPNAAIPIATVVGTSFAMLVGGVVVTESVFSIPGLGTLTLDAVMSRDFPIIQAVVLFFSFLYVAMNLLVDMSYAFFDPRVVY